MAGTTQPTTNPTTTGEAEDRFTKGLVFDVLKVLDDHGYGRLSGPQTVDLMLHLLHFLHGEGGSCMGRTLQRQELDDVAQHRATIDSKVKALRASGARVQAALARVDARQEVAGHDFG